MRFPVMWAFDSAVETSRVHDYGSIRLTTLAWDTADAPLSDLRGRPPVWESPTKASFAYFSAMCWFFGRNIADALDRKVPIGLIAASYSSSRIQAWGPRGFESQCPDPTVYAAARGHLPLGVLWNAMIAPLAVGPLALKGIAWYQGESDRFKPSVYACAFPALINRWRAEFKAPDLYFGFVLVAPCGGDVAFRAAQMAAAALPRVGYATAEDYGDRRSPYKCMHPRNKQAPAARLALSALDIAYGLKGATPWRMPMFEAAYGTVDPASCDWDVVVSFTNETLGRGGGVVVHPSAFPAQCPADVPASNCARPMIVGSDGSLHVATVVSSASGREVVFRAAAAGAHRSAAPARVLYAVMMESNNSWPLYSIYSTHVVTTRFDKVPLPARSFNGSVTLRGSAACRGTASSDVRGGLSSAAEVQPVLAKSSQPLLLQATSESDPEEQDSGAAGRPRRLIGTAGDASAHHINGRAGDAMPHPPSGWFRKSVVQKMLVAAVALFVLCLLPAAWLAVAAQWVGRMGRTCGPCWLWGARSKPAHVGEKQHRLPTAATESLQRPGHWQRRAVS
jgi:hypothetical protein